MTDIHITTKWSDVKPHGYYVYLHKRATDGGVFYVGKGKGNRAWRWRDTRNPHWINIANKHGVIVDIVKDSMSETCAFTLEKILIGSYGVGSLCNISNGGEGASGLAAEKHHAYNHRKYTFLNKDGRSFRGTPYDFEKKYNLSQSLISHLINGKRMSHKGWRLEGTSLEETGMRGERVWNYDRKIRKFYHQDGTIFIGTQRQLIDRYRLPQAQVSAMISGRPVKSTRGWFADRENLLNVGSLKSNNPSYDFREWKFTHKNGSVFFGTQYEFRVEHDLDFRSVSSLVNGKIKTHKGWSCKEVSHDADDTQGT